MGKGVVTALAVALSILILDQATKWWVLATFDPVSWPLRVTSYFNLTLVWNRGISFGLFGEGGEFGRWFLTALALIIAGALVIWLWRGVDLLTRYGIALVLGGAIGNAIDRVMYGAVVDFLDFHVAGFHWYTFNVADTGVVVGAITILAASMLNERRQSTDAELKE